MYVILAFLIMYQHSGIDVCNSYTAEDILHNFREQELVGRNEYYYMFRRSDTGRGSLMHYSSYMVGCFRRYDRIMSRGISFTYTPSASSGTRVCSIYVGPNHAQYIVGRPKVTCNNIQDQYLYRHLTHVTPIVLERWPLIQHRQCK